MSFAEKLNNLIEKTNDSNYAIAKHLKVSRKAVMKWRNGETEPTGKNLNNLAYYFGVPPSYFYDDQACAPTLKGRAFEISEKIEKFLEKHPEEASRIEEVIDAITREPGEFRQRSTTTGSQTERKEESRTKKSRRKTA